MCCRCNSYFTFIARDKHDFFGLWFLLLLGEVGLSPEGCLAICHPGAAIIHRVFGLGSALQEKFNFCF